MSSSAPPPRRRTQTRNARYDARARTHARAHARASRYTRTRTRVAQVSAACSSGMVRASAAANEVASLDSAQVHPSTLLRRSRPRTLSRSALALATHATACALGRCTPLSTS